MSLDPVLEELFVQVPNETSLPIDWEAFRAEAETMLPIFQGPCPPMNVGSVEQRELIGEGGPIALRIYRPTVPTSTTLIHIHGGGWALGNLDGVDHTVRYFCEKLPAVVVSCTYRLAPENQFPAAFDDALAAAKWVMGSVAELGGDPGKVLITGDSAGGNLAAAVTLALRNDSSGLPSLAGQLLLYPALDLRPEASNLPSRLADRDPTLRANIYAEMISAYVDADQSRDPRASPSAELDLAGLPPTLTVVLDVDPLRDEAIMYADRLLQAGVKSEVLQYDHLTHGFTHLRCVVPAASRAFDEVIDRFRRLVSDR